MENVKWLRSGTPSGEAILHSSFFILHFTFFPMIEPGILPLVEALSATGLVCTFSSCEGHFEAHEQTLRDRNHAEVRFLPAPNVPEQPVEAALSQWLARFKARHGLMPVTAVGYKLFTPLDAVTVEITFVLELRPFNRFDPPVTKRSDVDRAVRQMIVLMNDVQ
jgi:hypothetical protein